MARDTQSCVSTHRLPPTSAPSHPSLQLIFTTALFAIVNGYTDCVLAWAAARAQDAGHIHVGTYEEVAWRSLAAYYDGGRGGGGPGWSGGKRAYLVTVASVLIGCAGALVGYMIIIGDMASQVAATLCTADTSGCAVVTSRAFSTLLFAALFALPVSHCGRMHNMWCSSLLAGATVLIVGALVVSHGAITIADNEGYVPLAANPPAFNSSSCCGLGAAPPPGYGPPSLASSSFTIMLGLPISVFSLGNHIQAVPVFLELPRAAKARWHWAVAGSVAICFVLYLATGVFGYLAFGGGTEADVLLNFQSDNAFAGVAKALMVIHIALAMPVIVLPTRQASFMLSHVCRRSTAPMRICRLCCRADPRRPPPSPIGAAAAVATTGDDDDAGREVAELAAASASAAAAVREVCGMSCGVSVSLQNTAIVMGAAGIAILIPQLSLVFGLLGATSAVTQIHLVPGAILLAYAHELAGGHGGSGKTTERERLLHVAPPSGEAADGAEAHDGGADVALTPLPHYVPRSPFWLRVHAYGLLGLGTFVMLVGTGTNIYSSFIAPD